ncbi:MAG: DUF2914 domain-containing protein [Patescibacteria group bacterium]
MKHRYHRTKDNISRLKEWVRTNERMVTSGAFVGGFGLDLITLNRIDQWFDNAILLTYLFLGALAILIINTDIEERFGSEIIHRLSPLALYLAQFAFGGLLSGFVIFYSKSASWYVAWPFMLALILLFLANDRMRDYYRRLEVQTGMLFGAILAMAIFFVPTMLGMVGDMIFILSGIVSIALIAIYLKGMYALLPSISDRRRWKIRRNIFFIFVIFNLLYFANIIPPIPLSLKHGDIYYSVIRSGPSTYTVTYEYEPWWQINQYFDRREFVKTSASDTVFILASVFGPSGLNAPIYHKWQWYNPKTEKWQDVLESKYNLTGGRDDGFRWYSFVQNPALGEWRVRITTNFDREIGRIPFTVVRKDQKPEIRSKEL